MHININGRTGISITGMLCRMPDERAQSKMAYKSGVSFQGKPVRLAVGGSPSRRKRFIPNFGSLARPVGGGQSAAAAATAKSRGGDDNYGVDGRKTQVPLGESK